MARRLATELRRELPGLLVDDDPEVVDGVWTLRVVLPSANVDPNDVAGAESGCVLVGVRTIGEALDALVT